jgi:hypothetical protein
MEPPTVGPRIRLWGHCLRRFGLDAEYVRIRCTRSSCGRGTAASLRLTCTETSHPASISVLPNCYASFMLGQVFSYPTAFPKLSGLVHVPAWYVHTAEYVDLMLISLRISLTGATK